jgi:hypothetical protein
MESSMSPSPVRLAAEAVVEQVAVAAVVAVAVLLPAVVVAQVVDVAAEPRVGLNPQRPAIMCSICSTRWARLPGRFLLKLRLLKLVADVVAKVVVPVPAADVVQPVPLKDLNRPLAVCWS